MEGLLTLTLWSNVIDVLEPSASRARRDLSNQLTTTKTPKPIQQSTDNDTKHAI